MSSYDDMINFVGEVKEKAGHVDWLISNAGISTYDKFQDYTFEEWNKIVNTNLCCTCIYDQRIYDLL